MLLGLGLDPRPGELDERRRSSAYLERHRDYSGDGAVLQPARGQVAKQSLDSLVLPSVPTVGRAGGFSSRTIAMGMHEA